MLNEVELLIACRNREVFSVRSLVCALGAERWVRQNKIKALGIRHLVNRITASDDGIQTMKIEVHERQASGTSYKFLAVIRALFDALGKLPIKCPAFGRIHQP